MPGTDLAPDLVADAALLEEAVRKAGETALAYFGNAPRSWRKDDDSPVSEADIATDKVLSAVLRGGRPDYGWMSEESGTAPAIPARAPVWVVDPIDGTRAFLQGRGEWTVSAALVDGGRPGAAAVYNPAEDLYFSALPGGGAWLNGEPIEVSDRAGLAGARMLAQKNVMNSRRWKLPWPDMEVLKVNSIAYRICLVASGRFDAALSFNPKSDWDLAAADLILREAGGLITAFNGAAFVYNRPPLRHPNVVCAGKTLHEELVAHIAASDSR